MMWLLALVLVVAPHPDDEVTLYPVIEQAEAVEVAVLTDGAGSSKCPAVGCSEVREAASRGALAEINDEAVLRMYGEPDGGLTVERAEFLLYNVCDGCELWAAAADYGHPDHTALRTAVSRLGGRLYDGALRDSSRDRDIVSRWFGWLGPWQGRWHHLGLG